MLNREGAKYNVNPLSSEDDADHRTESRPNSVYSEDSKGTTDSGGTPSTNTFSSTIAGDGDFTENTPSVSVSTPSIVGNGGSYTGTKVTLISKKKGLVVNPDYI